MLKKIRDSHDMMKYLVSKKQLELLSYNKRRVICSSSSAESSHHSSSDEDLNFKQKIEKSIIRGMSLKTEQKKDLLSDLRLKKAKTMFAKVKSIGVDEIHLIEPSPEGGDNSA